jgi:hypothetical protein
MLGGTDLICPRDATPTRLTCTQCGTPICPACMVRTDVGLRCPDCAGGVAVPASANRRRRRRVLAAAAVVAAAVLALLVVALVLRGRGGSSGPAADGPQHVLRPDLGFSVDLPPTWVADIDQTPGSIFFARSTPIRSSARVFRGETEQPIEQNVGNVVDELRKQGARDFAQQPVQIGDLTGIRLDYVASDGPNGVAATHSSYRFKKGNAVFSLSLATTDPAADNPVLAGIAASFRVL